MFSCKYHLFQESRGKSVCPTFDGRALEDAGVAGHAGDETADKRFRARVGNVAVPAQELPELLLVTGLVFTITHGM